MLQSSSLKEANIRRRECSDSPAMRVAYASLLLRLHVPQADAAVIQAIPDSSAQMEQIYSFSGYSDLASDAYGNYYTRLFALARTQPRLLPKLFAVAAQFGSSDPNIDEETWFCEEQRKLYEQGPKAYMNAVKETRPPFYRRVALDCREGPP